MNVYVPMHAYTCVCVSVYLLDIFLDRFRYIAVCFTRQHR